MLKTFRWTLAGAAAALIGGPAMAQVKEIRIGYQPNPIQESSIAILEKLGAKHGVKIIKVPNFYSAYLEKTKA